jgi:hypothetical protein
MKAQPFLSGDSIGARLEWQRRDILVEAGGNLALNPGVLVQVRGEKVVWTTRGDDGALRFNIRVVGSDGREMLHLEENEWTVTGPIDDLRASASGHSIRMAAPCRGVALAITFHSVSEADVRAACQRDAESHAGIPRIPADLIARLPPDLVQMSTPSREQLFDEAWAPFARAGIKWPAMHVTLSCRLNHPTPIRITRSKMEVSDLATMTGSRLFMPGATLISLA